MATNELFIRKEFLCAPFSKDLAVSQSSSFWYTLDQRYLRSWGGLLTTRIPDTAGVRQLAITRTPEPALPGRTPTTHTPAPASKAGTITTPTPATPPKSSGPTTRTPGGPPTTTAISGADRQS